MNNSLIAAMNFAIVVAHSHFIPVSVPCKKVERDMEKANISVRILVEISSQAWGALVITVKPQYVFSSDDTVVYIYEGKANKQGTFRLVSTKSLKAPGNQSKYSIDESCIMNGMQVKLTFTFIAAGTSTSLFVTVTELNTRILSGRSHLLVKVKGLCVGGGKGKRRYFKQMVCAVHSSPSQCRSREIYISPAEHYVTICHKELR